MTTWLKANLVPLLVAVAVLMAIGTVSGWVRASHFEGVAEAEAAAKERAREDLEAQTDSADAARERALTATREAEAQREAHDSVVARLSARIRDLSASHDSLEAAAEAELAEHAGWLSRATHEAVVDNLERTLLATDSLRVEAEALARTERKRGDALEVQVGALMAQVSTLTEITETQEREIEALRQANSAGGIFPDFGDLTAPVYAIVGAGLGYLAAAATDDRESR